MRNKFENFVIIDYRLSRSNNCKTLNLNLTDLIKNKLQLSFLLVPKKIKFDKKINQRRTMKEYFESYSNSRNADQKFYTIEKKLTLGSILILQKNFFVFLKDGEIVGWRNCRILDFMSRISLIFIRIKELISLEKKKCFLSFKKSIDSSLFFNEPTGSQVGSFSFLDYIKRYIARIKSRFDDFLKKEYRRKPYLRIT